MLRRSLLRIRIRRIRYRCIGIASIRDHGFMCPTKNSRRRRVQFIRFRQPPSNKRNNQESADRQNHDDRWDERVVNKRFLFGWQIGHSFFLVCYTLRIAQNS